MAPDDPVGPAHPPAGPPLAFVEDLDRPVLAEGDHRHLGKALRVAPGDPLVVADGAGRWRRCRFGPEPDPDGPVVEAPAPAPVLTVAFALVKGGRPELVVQKLTELGIDRIVPFVAARSVVRWDEARAGRHAERLDKVAREAAMQCRRARLPVVEALAPFAEVAARPGAAGADRGGAPPDLSHPTVLVGPEGGWSPEERAQLAHVVGLADHVLRAETAAIAAGTLLAGLRAGVVVPGHGASRAVSSDPG